MPDEVDNVERVIADGLRSFLDGSTSDEEPVPLLAAALGRLFERFLAEEEGWPRFARIDDAQPEALTPIDSSTVAVAGLAMIVDGNRWASQPFRAVFQLGPSRSTLDAFRLSLGDARADLYAVTHEAKRPKDWPNVPAWTFAFNRSGSDLPG